MPVKCRSVHEITDLCRTWASAYGTQACLAVLARTARSADQAWPVRPAVWGCQAQRGGGGLQPAPRRAKRSAAARRARRTSAARARKIETEGGDAPMNGGVRNASCMFTG